MPEANNHAFLAVRLLGLGRKVRFGSIVDTRRTIHLVRLVARSGHGCLGEQFYEYHLDRKRAWHATLAYQRCGR